MRPMTVGCAIQPIPCRRPNISEHSMPVTALAKVRPHGAGLPSPRSKAASFSQTCTLQSRRKSYERFQRKCLAWISIPMRSARG